MHPQAFVLTEIRLVGIEDSVGFGAFLWKGNWGVLHIAVHVLYVILKNMDL